MEIWEPKPSGTLWATPGLLWDGFSFKLLIIQVSNINVFALLFQHINLRDMNARHVTEHMFPAVVTVVRTCPYTSS
jgi:hypothetical protein